MLELEIKFNTPPLLNEKNKKQNNKNKMSNLMKIETSFVKLEMKNFKKIKTIFRTLNFRMTRKITFE